MNFGYACINTCLADQKIHVNRSMVKRTFLAKGVVYASELAFRNISDFEKLIDWNVEHGLLFYRMSSDMFPWMSEYEIGELPDYARIKEILSRVGEKVKDHNLRLTYHPGPFNVLATNSDLVIQNTVKELRQHGEIMDLIGLPRSPFAKINIHIGGAYGDRYSAIERFIKNFSLLPQTASSRLTVENDDKASMFSVGDLMQVHHMTGIPVVFDYHHHQFRTGDLTTREALMLALSTWPKGIKPVVHYSSSKRVFEDATSHDTSHADYVYRNIDTFQQDVDVMLEAKAKEKATLRFMSEFARTDVRYKSGKD